MFAISQNKVRKKLNILISFTKSELNGGGLKFILKYIFMTKITHKYQSKLNYISKKENGKTVFKRK